MKAKIVLVPHAHDAKLLDGVTKLADCASSVTLGDIEKRNPAIVDEFVSKLTEGMLANEIPSRSR